MVPQQWLAHTSAPGGSPQDRRRLDLVVYGASPQDMALCCDTTSVSPISTAGTLHPHAADTPPHGGSPQARHILGGGVYLTSRGVNTHRSASTLGSCRSRTGPGTDPSRPVFSLCSVHNGVWHANHPMPMVGGSACVKSPHWVCNLDKTWH